MPKSQIPHNVSGFVALPIALPSVVLNGKSCNVEHYIYIKAYEPKIPDEESPRALLLLNVPVTANEAQIRHLLHTQIGGAHVQHVYFADSTSPNQNSSLIATTAKKSQTYSPSTTLGKRKRETVEDIETRLSSYSLPQTFPSTIHASGSSAIAVFLDRSSRDQTLKRLTATAKSHTSVPWCADLAASKQPPLGLARVIAHRELSFPARADLLRSVDDYMTTYAELEAARAKESAKKRAEPDEDGFVTVTRGTRGVLKNDEAEAIKTKLEEKRKKEKGLEDFYRFQMRERKKGEQGELLRRFEDERKLVREMGERRKKVVDT